MKEWDDLWQTGATKVDGVTCYKLTGAVSDTPPHAMGQGVKGPSLYSVTIGSQVLGSHWLGEQVPVSRQNKPNRAVLHHSRWNHAGKGHLK